ncbi:MAG: hypothetical protein Q8L55_10565 [Phycisphaerales bacterium]|nr:hypothetical protein [Phycisphaerales bacterium]
MNRKVIVLLCACACGVPAFGQTATVDGARDGAYGASYWDQNTQTGFGDNSNEIDNLYSMNNLSTLFLFLGGNQVAGNNLDVFISSGAAGQNTLANFSNGAFNGAQFDSGFSATHYITANYSGGAWYVDIAVYNAGTNSWAGSYAGNFFSGTWYANGGSGIAAAHNNANTAGVTGGSGPSSGAGVTTGAEFALPFAWLGITASSTPAIAGYITNGARSFTSNQFIGGINPPQGNLGGGPNVNMENLGGTQHVVVPTPGAAVLMGVGIVAASRRRRV